LNFQIIELLNCGTGSVFGLGRLGVKASPVGRAMAEGALRDRIVEFQNDNLKIKIWKSCLHYNPFFW